MLECFACRNSTKAVRDKGQQGQGAKISTAHDLYVSPLQRGEAIHTQIDNSVVFL